MMLVLKLLWKAFATPNMSIFEGSVHTNLRGSNLEDLVLEVLPWLLLKSAVAISPRTAFRFAA